MVINQLLRMILQVDSYYFQLQDPKSSTNSNSNSSFQKFGYTSSGLTTHLVRKLGGSSHDLDTWLITMVIVSALRIGLFPFQMGCLWLINGGDPNHLLTGMILQAGLTKKPLDGHQNNTLSFNTSPRQKLPGPNRKGSSSNHHYPTGAMTGFYL